MRYINVVSLTFVIWLIIAIITTAIVRAQDTECVTDSCVQCVEDCLE